MVVRTNERTWLGRLWAWVNRWANKRKRNPNAHPTILKSWYGANCAVLSLRRQSKGAIATYRIVPRESGCNWLITWDDLFELRTERMGKLDGETVFLRTYEGQSPYTHGVCVWKIPRGSTVPHLIGAWLIELKISKALEQRRRKHGLKPIPCALAFDVAMHVKDMDLAEMSWSLRMERMDWLWLIRLYAKKYFDEGRELKAEPQSF